MAKKKSSNMFWYILIGIVVVFGGLVFFASQGSAVDYTLYDYTDDKYDNPDAAHVIVEYSDFQCPYCATMAPVLRGVKTDFDVRVEYKHFPLTNIHPFAQGAAEAAECARDQNKFWAYHDVIFANQQNLGKSTLIAHAKGLGLDVDQFKTCVNNREKQIVVQEHVRDGMDLGVRGTPTIYLDGELVNFRTYQEFALNLQ